MLLEKMHLLPSTKRMKEELDKQTEALLSSMGAIPIRPQLQERINHKLGAKTPGKVID